MRIGLKYLLWVNGVLLALWAAYSLSQLKFQREELIALELGNLRRLSDTVRRLGFHAGAPTPRLESIVRELAAVHPGTDLMVLDRAAIVVASSAAGRAGRRWQEADIDAVLDGHRALAWKVRGHSHGEHPVLDVTIPVTPPGARLPAHAVHVARRLDQVETMVSASTRHHVAFGLAALLAIGVALSLVTYVALVRPIGRLTAELAPNRWFQPEPGGRDELQRLMAGVARMAEEAERSVGEKEQLLAQVTALSASLATEVTTVKQQLGAAEAELVRTERLSAVGEMAAALAHELRNPLHIIRGAAELLTRRGPDQTSCAEILEEVQRINRFVTDLLDYTRALTPQPEPTAVLPVIESAIGVVRQTHAGAVGECAIECAAGVAVLIDAEHLRQVLVNLISNAVEAAGPGGRVGVSAAAGATRVQLRVSDTGPGIAAADVGRVFEPFFTRRAAGTGLGLSVVRRLVDLYGGGIAIDTRPGGGTTVMTTFARAGTGRGLEE